MGGHESGEIASKMAVKKIIEGYSNARKQWDRQSALELAVRHANRAIYDANDGKEKEARMGTTVAVVVIGDDGKWHSIHRGDTRIYNFAQRGPAQVGRDHSKVMDMVADGSLNTQDIFDHSENNKINKILGNRSDEEFNFNRCGYRGQLQPGESLLLCSDGLWEMLRDNGGRVIAPFLKGFGDVGDRIRNLISAANKAGGGDNISVGILEMRTENPVLSLINILKSLVDRKTFSFIQARSWQELFDQIASEGTIVGSKKEYTSAEIMNQINRFRDGSLDPIKITSGGDLMLRETVIRLAGQ